MKKIETPDISDTLYRAMFDKLEPEDFDKNNPVDQKLLEYLGWGANELS